MNIFESLQIDTRQLKTLLSVYLKQDFRSNKSVMRRAGGESVTSNRAIMMMVFFYTLTGFVIAISVFSLPDVFFYSAFASSFTFALVALAIVAESGNVIFNENEADIIGHLPINSRTLFTAKALNLFLFALLLAAAVNLAPALFGISAEGAGPLFILAHAVSITFVSMFASALVVTSYGLLIRYVDKERINNIIAYAQAGLAIFFIIGYQLLPRLLERNIENLNLIDRRYFLLYPPAWFTGITLLILGKFRWLNFALASLACLSLVILCLLALRKIAGGYASFVTQMAHDASGSVKAVQEKPTVPSQASRAGVREQLKATFLRNPVERAVFDLVSSYIKRDREIKVRLYPSFAYFIMFPLLGFFTNGLADPFLSQRFLFNSLGGCAMIPFVTLSAIEVILFSEHYQAAYIFYVAPVADLSAIHSGLRKAMLFYFALPGALVLFALYTILWRNPLHAGLILLPWVILTPAMIMVSFIRRELLPLSRKYQKGQQSARAIVVFFGNFSGLMVIGFAQTVAVTGVIPYWLFVLGITGFSLVMYFLLHLISGEIRPLVPSSSASYLQDLSES